MERVWYRTKELVERGYSQRRLKEMSHRPGQRYARKMNPAKRNSPLEWNLPLLIEAENKDLEMQGRARERRTRLEA